MQRWRKIGLNSIQIQKRTLNWNSMSMLVQMSLKKKKEEENMLPVFPWRNIRAVRLLNWTSLCLGGRSRLQARVVFFFGGGGQKTALRGFCPSEGEGQNENVQQHLKDDGILPEPDRSSKLRESFFPFFGLFQNVARDSQTSTRAKKRVGAIWGVAAGRRGGDTARSQAQTAVQDHKARRLCER